MQLLVFFSPVPLEQFPSKKFENITVLISDLVQTVNGELSHGPEVENILL